MRLLSPIIRVLAAVMNNFWYQLTMCNSIAPQFISHNLPGLTLVTADQPLEETPSCSAIPFGLQAHINNLPILVNGSPQIMLLAVYFHEDFINVKGVAETSVLSFQSSGVFGAKFIAPQAD